MKTLRKALILSVAMAALLVLPSDGMAAYLVPSDHSAVNQYTETYPTPQGQRDARRGVALGDRPPASILGKRNVQRLEAQGAAGESAALVAAATAPSGGKPIGASGGPAGSSGLDEVLTEATGISGLSESNGLGLLLPLIVLAALVWSVAYVWRRHGKPVA